MQKLSQVRIVLCETSHPGNIGAAARAIKNMGLSQLVLVNPACFPSAIATERSAGASDILANARVVGSVHEAIGDCELVFGTSARMREISWPQVDARTCAQKIVDHPGTGNIAIMFGTERSGLPNEYLSLCHYHLYIPANPDYSSLNLSQAVQVVCYELYQTCLAASEKLSKIPPPVQDVQPANLEEVLGVVDHLTEVMQAVEFIDPKPTRILMLRLKRLLFKSRLEIEEVNILRGIFKAILKKVAIPKINIPT